MSEFDNERFQAAMREACDALCRAAGYAVTGSGFTTRTASQSMADLCENNMKLAHVKLMEAKAYLNGSPCAATAVEIRGGEEIPLE